MLISDHLDSDLSAGRHAGVQRPTLAQLGPVDLTDTAAGDRLLAEAVGLSKWTFNEKCIQPSCISLWHSRYSWM